ncbi:hypothetical protein [Methylocystis bryophila]|uniref:Uncharacterized protein n=1 Tax=Methylocystis bryophila TaxID=655015 RepID=A0A1W6MW41_9HYPH|nr:hypothetical protein [Methylocystis bryophila]ARN81830.1 hypothetical protein B1812_12905 [Methylocystis bryophila]BDV37902.1 hypothetical protein DSM21852_11550 [Methylocystis bryophila]
MTTRPAPEASDAEIFHVKALIGECTLARGRGGEVLVEAPIATGARVSWRLRSPIVKRWIAGKLHARGLPPIGDAALDEIFDLLERAALDGAISISARRS